MIELIKSDASAIYDNPEISKMSLEQKKKLIDSFCKHLKNGFSDFSFPNCDPLDIERLAKELDADASSKLRASQVQKIKKALRENLKFWEDIGIKGIKGIRKKGALFTNFNSSAYIFYMKIRFGLNLKEFIKDKSGNDPLQLKLLEEVKTDDTVEQ